MKPWQITLVFASTQTLAVAESRRAARSDGVRSDSVERSIFWLRDSSALWVSPVKVSASCDSCSGGLFGNGTVFSLPKCPLIAQIAPESNGSAAKTRLAAEGTSEKRSAAF